VAADVRVRGNPEKMWDPAARRRQMRRGLTPALTGSDRSSSGSDQFRPFPNGDGPRSVHRSGSSVPVT